MQISFFIPEWVLGAVAGSATTLALLAGVAWVTAMTRRFRRAIARD